MSCTGFPDDALDKCTTATRIIRSAFERDADGHQCLRHCGGRGNAPKESFGL